MAAVNRMREPEIILVIPDYVIDISLSFPLPSSPVCHSTSMRQQI